MVSDVVKTAEKAPLRVLLVYREIIPSITISALQPLQALEKRGSILLSHAGVQSKKAEQLLLWCDIVVCGRNCFGDELPFQLKLRQLNIPYIYDCDDNFLRLQSVNDPSVAYLRWPGSMEAVKAYMRHAFAIKVGSWQLAEDCREYNPHSVLQRYCFDMGIIADVSPPIKRDESLLIGYAGSITHTLDMKIALEAIHQVMKEYANISFVCYGVAVAGMEEWGQRVTCVPYAADYRSFLRDFASRGIDIAIAPLSDTPANRSKTNNKYREYGACGVPCIYSDMPVYSSCIRDGDNGLLCANDTRAWTEALRKLIGDQKLREHIARRAREDVAAHYSVSQAAEEWMSGLLLPALQSATPVVHGERESVLSHGMGQRRTWLREQFGSTKEWIWYWLFVGYNRGKHGLKKVLSRLGLLPFAKRVKAEALNRRLQGMKLAEESRHELI